ncbi:hypothetical protein ACIBQX_48305 [Nonomuraea sp. NPDC049714]|uniref:hypothetical protein n=1 Tax=Nonomuraea sp. NPDC049714 TaxID=3364357 RepID=UPI0037A513D0
MSEATEILVWVIKWVGVVITIIGAFIAAPDAAQSLFGGSWKWVKRQARKVLPKKTRVVAIGTAYEANASGSLSVRKSGGHNWPEDARVDQQVAMLRAYIEDVEVRLNQTMDAVAAEQTTRDAALHQLKGELRGEIDQVRALIDQQEREAVKIDTRGMFPIAIGVLFGNVPEFLASWPGWYLPWLWPFAGLGVTIAIAAIARKDRRLIDSAPRLSDH